jgi:transposase
MYNPTQGGLAMTKQKQDRGMCYYAGLDVGLKSTFICVVDDEGTQVHACEVASDAAVISRALSSLKLTYQRVGLETGQLSIHLSKALRAKGFAVVCMDARQVAAALSTTVNKTDKNDARGIAHLLRCGLYREVHVKSDAACDTRILLASRRQLMVQVASLESTLRGLLKIHGVVLGPANRLSFIPRIRQAIEPLGSRARAGLEALIMSLEHLRTACKSLDAEVKKQASQDTRSRLLMSMPGVGPLTSSMLVTTLDDAGRFTKSRSVGAYLGLTPRQYASGETQRQGRISRAGPAECRAMLYEAAHCLLHFYKKPSRLKAWGLKLAKKKGMQRAIVAVARRMAVILHRMLVTGQPFDDAKLKAV